MNPRLARPLALLACLALGRVVMTQLRPWDEIDMHPKVRALVYQAIEGPAR